MGGGVGEKHVMGGSTTLRSLTLARGIDFTDIVNKRQFKAAYDLARNDNSYLGRVMTTGMGRLQYGIEDAREAAFQMVDTIKSSKEQLVAYLATIGATLVNRHASCFMLGNPRLWKRAMAPRRSSFNHSGACPAPFPAHA